MNQCPPGPWVFLWGLFESFRKFAEILPVSLSPVNNYLQWQRRQPYIYHRCRCHAVWGVYGGAISRRFQWHHWWPRPTPAAGVITVFSRRRTCSCHAVRSFAARTDRPLWLQQFISGVVNNIFPRCHWYLSEVTKKPNILHRYIFRRVTKKLWSHDCSTTGKPTHLFRTKCVSLDSV